MNITVPRNVAEVEFWKFRPSAEGRTRPKRLRNPQFIRAVQHALQLEVEELHYCPETLRDERYVVVLKPQRGKPCTFTVNGNILKFGTACYYTPSRQLWAVLEKHVSKRMETESIVGKPCFIRRRA